jgi:hypothetical protein
MEKTIKILKWEFYSTVVIALVMIIIFENDILISGAYACDKTSEFFAATVMEILTICAIPLALRLFKFKSVHNSIVADEAKAASKLLSWASLRMGLLCIPLIVNALLYYLYMNVAFGYMGIILFLSLFFIYPSKQRCLDEVVK